MQGFDFSWMSFVKNLSKELPPNPCQWGWCPTRHQRALTTIQTTMKKLKPPLLNMFVCVFVLRWSRRLRRWCRSLQTQRTTRVPHSRTCPCSLRTSTVWDAPAPTPATRTVSTAQCSVGHWVSFTARHRTTQSGCCYVSPPHCCTAVPFHTLLPFASYPDCLMRCNRECSLAEEE